MRARSHRIAAALILTTFGAATGWPVGAAFAASAAAPAGSGAATSAPASLSAASGTAVAGQYLVVLRRGATGDTATAVARRTTAAGGKVRHQYRSAVRGFSAQLDPAQLAAVRRDPQVAYVEPNQVVRADATQPAPDWGLDRIDQRTGPLSGSYTYTATGSGVTVYVVDSGIRLTHKDFGGRASSGFTSIVDGNGTNDCNGHGTHVAASVGGTTYGVAKQAKLVAVRVLDCNGSGTVEGVIAGLDWITQHHAARSVANLSLGGDVSQALDDAVAASIASGVTYAIAAGNNGGDACAHSPARVPAALTVAASDRYDFETSYSNGGPCVDVFAPGDNITSAWNTSDTATKRISGTSMAAPHVAGVAALHLQSATDTRPQATAKAITSTATPGILSFVSSGTPDLLLFSGLTPPPGTTGCTTPSATYSTQYTAGGYIYLPGTNGFALPREGQSTGCLYPPSGTTGYFTLYLEHLVSGSWQYVGQAWTFDGAMVQYSTWLQPGTYRWKVYASPSSNGTPLTLTVKASYP